MNILLGCKKMGQRMYGEQMWPTEGAVIANVGAASIAHVSAPYMLLQGPT